jgi:hypothetical protein
VLALRHRYRQAYTAYLSCVIALSDVALDGTKLTQDLIDNEARSLKEMNEAREALLAAIFAQIEAGKS